MNHILHNYRSDIALVEIFYRYDEEKNELVATEIPDIEIDFEFTYRAEDHREFTAGRKAGAYFNCKPITNSSIEVYIPLSRHQLGTGILVHFLNLHTPNGNFPEGVQNICVPASTSYMLHKGPSEPTTTTATSILGSEVFGRAFTIEVLHDAGAETPYCLPDGGSAAVRAMRRFLLADRDTTQILFVLRDAQTGEQSYDFATAVNDCKELGPDGGERNLLTLGGSVWLAKRRYLLQLTYDKAAEAFDPIVCNLLPSGMAQNTGNDPDWTMSQKAITQELAQVRMDFAEGDRLTLQTANEHTDMAVADEAKKRVQGDTATLQSANEHTDTAVADEANKRAQGDTATLQSAKGYTDNRETAIRADIATNDANTLAAAKQYTDNAETGIRNDMTTESADVRNLIATRVGLPVFNAQNYTLTFTAQNGASVVVDLPLETMGLDYDAATKEMVYTAADGSKRRISLTEFVDIYVGSIGSEIQITVDTSNVIRAALLDGSIGWSKLSTALQAEINAKVDKVAGKRLSTEDYTSPEKAKLAGIESGANNYKLPDTLPASMVATDATHRFVSDSEKSTWNNKVGSSSVKTIAGPMTAAQYAALTAKDANTLYIITD